MVSDKDLDRRDFLQGITAATIPGLAGCNTLTGSSPESNNSDPATPTATPEPTPTETPTPTPQPTFGEPTVSLGLPNRVEAWREYQLDCTVDAEPTVERVTIEVSGKDTQSEKEINEELTCGDTFSPPTWGQYSLTIHLESAGGNQHTLDSKQVHVHPKTPDQFNAATFDGLLDKVQTNGIDIDSFLTEFEGLNAYTSEGTKIFDALEHLISNYQQEIAVDLVGTIVTQIQNGDKGLTASDLQYVTAIPNSPDSYAAALANGYISAFKYDSLRNFEIELYELDEALQGGLKPEQDRDEIQTELAQTLSEARTNLMEKGHLTAAGLDYLRTFTEIARCQVFPDNPRWQEAEQLVSQHTSDGEIEARDQDDLEEVRQFEAADLYSDSIKEHVIGVPTHLDTVLLEVEYTKIVDEAASKDVLQKALNDFYASSGIAIIAPQLEESPLGPGTSSFTKTDHWKKETKPDLPGLSRKGMYRLTIDTDVSDDYAGLAVPGDSANYTIVDIDTSSPTYYRNTIIHEVGHILGLWSSELSWVDEESVDDGYEHSYMSYPRLDEEMFLGPEITEMRDSKYEMEKLSMETIEEWAEEGTTLTDKYNEVLTPEGIDLDPSTADD